MPRRRIAPARPLLAAALVVATLAGCAAKADPSTLPDAPSGRATEQTGAPGDGPTTKPTAVRTPALDVYVAMGDSYTAAPLFPLDDNTVIDDCLRSGTNYPTLVADELGITVNDVSCSGASTVSIFGEQKFTSKVQPPQIDALSPDADLVTVGIGANDFTFFSDMIFDCLAVADRDVTGSPCRAANTDAAGQDRLERNVVKIRNNVKKVVEAISARAPEARILLVGYPQLIPSEGTCRARLPLAVGDYAYTLELNLRLAQAVRNGGVSAGAEYVDLVGASQGHDICSAEPWVAGIRGKDNKAAGLHPYPAEQEAVADLVVGML
ncbi:SGNH/GDSL hydrolase family protein [Nocardioides sp.]|uniref:SGNH/GDSL hydrolase family protein n=1 Tax=Nocardioides sp. TaxID=35761 RepID=UPI002722772B|nr:SGNH/GDSL hydrolase family protein [Nocardioides sp.]MDO9455574.1 SGNH/GDSL hydrolase family protein [Nocardioides sp.]